MSRRHEGFSSARSRRGPSEKIITRRIARLPGVQTQNIYEITASYAIALHFSGGPIDEDALVRMGCTKRSRNGKLLFIYHCMTTIEFRKTYTRWKAIALRAPCAFYLGR